MTYTDDITRVGKVKSQLTELKEYCGEITKLTEPSVSNYVVGARREKWFERRFLLTMPPEILEADHNERIYGLGQRLYPGNHCCLFLYYPPGAYIRPHRDHSASEAKVVQINLGCPITLYVGEQQHQIEDGEAISFNSKALHATTPATSERYVISWRKIKPHYLNPQLSLFP